MKITIYTKSNPVSEKHLALIENLFDRQNLEYDTIAVDKDVSKLTKMLTMLPSYMKKVGNQILFPQIFVMPEAVEPKRQMVLRSSSLVRSLPSSPKNNIDSSSSRTSSRTRTSSKLDRFTYHKPLYIGSFKEIRIAVMSNQLLKILHVDKLTQNQNVSINQIACKQFLKEGKEFQNSRRFFDNNATKKANPDTIVSHSMIEESSREQKSDARSRSLNERDSNLGLRKLLSLHNNSREHPIKSTKKEIPPSPEIKTKISEKTILKMTNNQKNEKSENHPNWHEANLKLMKSEELLHLAEPKIQTKTETTEPIIITSTKNSGKVVNKTTSSIPEDKLLNTLKAKGTLNLKNSSKIDVKDLFTEIHKQHTNKITTHNKTNKELKTGKDKTQKYQKDYQRKKIFPKSNNSKLEVVQSKVISREKDSNGSLDPKQAISHSDYHRGRSTDKRSTSVSKFLNPAESSVPTALINSLNTKNTDSPNLQAENKKIEDSTAPKRKLIKKIVNGKLVFIEEQEKRPRVFRSRSRAGRGETAVDLISKTDYESIIKGEKTIQDLDKPKKEKIKNLAREEKKSHHHDHKNHKKDPKTGLCSCGKPIKKDPLVEWFRQLEKDQNLDSLNDASRFELKSRSEVIGQTSILNLDHKMDASDTQIVIPKPRSIFDDGIDDDEIEALARMRRQLDNDRRKLTLPQKKEVAKSVTKMTEISSKSTPEIKSVNYQKTDEAQTKTQPPVSKTKFKNNESQAKITIYLTNQTAEQTENSLKILRYLTKCQINHKIINIRQEAKLWLKLLNKLPKRTDDDGEVKRAPQIYNHFCDEYVGDLADFLAVKDTGSTKKLISFLKLEKEEKISPSRANVLTTSAVIVSTPKFTMKKTESQTEVSKAEMPVKVKTPENLSRKSKESTPKLIKQDSFTNAHAEKLVVPNFKSNFDEGLDIDLIAKRADSKPRMTDKVIEPVEISKPAKPELPVVTDIKPQEPEKPPSPKIPEKPRRAKSPSPLLMADKIVVPKMTSVNLFEEPEPPKVEVPSKSPVTFRHLTKKLSPSPVIVRPRSKESKPAPPMEPKPVPKPEPKKPVPIEIPKPRPKSPTPVKPKSPIKKTTRSQSVFATAPMPKPPPAPRPKTKKKQSSNLSKFQQMEQQAEQQAKNSIPVKKKDDDKPKKVWKPSTAIASGKDFDINKVMQAASIIKEEKPISRKMERSQSLAAAPKPKIFGLSKALMDYANEERKRREKNELNLKIKKELQERKERAKIEGVSLEELEELDRQIRECSVTSSEKK